MYYWITNFWSCCSLQPGTGMSRLVLSQNAFGWEQECAFRASQRSTRLRRGPHRRTRLEKQLLHCCYARRRGYRSPGRSRPEGQVLKLTEHEARSKFPGRVIASLGAKKEKPCEIITARVLHDGTNGISVNRRICLRDQERPPSLRTSREL